MHGCLSALAGAALYLGVLTSISPCPLATNIAAISYVGRKVGSPRAVMAAGLLYTLGAACFTSALAVLLASTAMSIRAVSLFLQKYMHLVLGPIFLVLGMFLVGLIATNLGGATMSEGMQKRVDAMGIWGALLLGVLFAVSFCPTSAAWFFGLLGADDGLRGRRDHRHPGQGRHRPPEGVAARRHLRAAAASTAWAPPCPCCWSPSCWPTVPNRSAKPTTCSRRSSGGRGRSRAGSSCWRGSTSR